LITSSEDVNFGTYFWFRGDFGRLGHGNLIDLFIPHPVRALNGLEIKHMACGDSHCIALTSNGEVLSWGRNQNGQLGLGHKEDSLRPCKVQAFELVQSTQLLSQRAESCMDGDGVSMETWV
jgi:alpha-tubulin suppressor-like RCC1 family protein